MAKVQILGQRCPHGDKMLIRGVFTQKVKLWAGICNLLVEAGVLTQAQAKEAIKTGKLECLYLFDDIAAKTVPATYGTLCKHLQVMGRAAFVEDDRRREFQVVDALTNEIRGWDVDEEGPRCNPAGK